LSAQTHSRRIVSSENLFIHLGPYFFGHINPLHCTSRYSLGKEIGAGNDVHIVTMCGLPKWPNLDTLKLDAAIQPGTASHWVILIPLSLGHLETI